ncbi:VOC family protein [Cognatilysobacter terrigena]|uniref:VOC family protein n=1 Tax=Cognatilysobacter terrigena TaxID=2488749 RepID=UPI00105F1BA7|nr:VOC family protein [Lysobacter terrigena]
MNTALHAVRKPHLSLNVRDVDAAVAFYSALFGTLPVKHYHDDTTVHSVLQDDTGRDSRQTRTGYAKFNLDSPALNFVLNQIPGTRFDAKGTLSHLGLQVDSTDDVIALRDRAVAAGLTPRDEMAVSCCYARQDKFWLADPDGNEWEIFTVLEHLTPEQLRERDTRSACDTGCATSCTPQRDEVVCCGA